MPIPTAPNPPPAEQVPDPPLIEVDALRVARGLGLDVDPFRQLTATGKIQTLSERGIGADLGRFRLSFYYGKRRVRLITDASGRVLADIAPETR